MTRVDSVRDGGVVVRESQHAEEPPPFGRSWRTLYTAVLVNLALLVVLFYIFTRAFR
jgi:hypothetical protein